MPVNGTILFSAFEPSGDALASRLITELKRRDPDCKIMALGGPRMKAAGAELIETTTEHAVMLAGALKHAHEHHQRLKRVDAWLSANKIDALVPTDSPAANWGICKKVRKRCPDAKIVHLAAPQLWAWAPWRIKKLRRLTDHVLCLLPFEPDWFGSRGVDATFVGHPLFESEHAQLEQGEGDAVLAYEGKPKFALLPGSRPSEITKNWPTMLDAYVQLKQKYPEMEAVVAASDEHRQKAIIDLCPNSELPEGMHIQTGKAGSVLDWADVGLIVSGTATLQAVTHHTPMVSLYNVTKLGWNILGRWLIRNRPLTLPNLLSQHIIGANATTELIPHFGEVQPVVEALLPLMEEGDARNGQVKAFKEICDVFQTRVFSQGSADKFMEVIGA
ncbi:lipid-A-disaccharide synthase [Planctomycetota bacterium]|nr:lipid-A-disaccharide synthase [Planctomycetota bacterium]